jgi:hypothetical protein
VIASRCFLLRVRNASNKSCRENQSTYFMLSGFFFRKMCCLWDNVEKYDGAREDLKNMAPVRGIVNKQGYSRARTHPSSCTHTYPSTHTRTDAHTHTQTHTGASTHKHAFTHAGARTHTHKHTHTHTEKYVILTSLKAIVVSWMRLKVTLHACAVLYVTSVVKVTHNYLLAFIHTYQYMPAYTQMYFYRHVSK